MKLVLQLLLFLSVAVHPAVAQSDQPQTIINDRTLTAEQKTEFLRQYGTPPLEGNFWYDPISGLWGVKGREASGILRPGHAYGAVSPTASAGNTGVFVNGRQLNMAEALQIRNLFGSVWPGQWWLDGATGNFGSMSSPVPVGNLFALAQSRSGVNASGSKPVCRTGTTGKGDAKIDYIIGCE